MLQQGTQLVSPGTGNLVTLLLESVDMCYDGNVPRVQGFHAVLAGTRDVDVGLLHDHVARLRETFRRGQESAVDRFAGDFGEGVPGLAECPGNVVCSWLKILITYKNEVLFCWL